MNYIYAKHFREFTDFTVKEVYKPYRSGGIKVKDKFIGKTFKQKDGSWYEEVWKDNKPVLSDEPVNMEKGEWKEWFNTYKKVFDVVIETPTEITIDGKTGTEFTIKALGARKIQDIIKSDMDFDVPMNGDKEAFDWEDDIYEMIKGCTYKMKYRGRPFDAIEEELGRKMTTKERTAAMQAISYNFQLVSKGQPGDAKKETQDAFEEDLPF